MTTKQPVNEKEFVFPTKGELPHRDGDAGIAFQNGGVRGVYQAGVIHAFVMCGYYPHTIGGTSVGSLSGAILALAAQLDHQSERMDLVDEYLAVWEANPGGHFFDLVRNGGVGNLIDDLLNINLSVGELVQLLEDLTDTSASSRGRSLWSKLHAAIQLVRKLPGRCRGRIVVALFGEIEAERTHFSGANLVQRILDAYSVHRSLCTEGPLESLFGHIFDKYASEGRNTRFDTLTRSDLVFQLANLSRKRRIFTIGKTPSKSVQGTLAGEQIFPALQAGSSFSPMFAPIRLGDFVDFTREINSRNGSLAQDFDANDQIMDAADISKDALAPVIGRWTDTNTEGNLSHRLFAVYHSPVCETKARSNSPFVGHALRSLELRDDLDLTYNTDIVSLITSMVDALREKQHEMPARAVGEGTYLPIRTSVIAPREILPVSVLCSPDKSELLEAAALGCQGTLETLHERAILALAQDQGQPFVSCADLLKKVRASQQSTRTDHYFEPRGRICSACSRTLRPLDRPMPRPKEVANTANDFAPFHENAKGKRKLTIVVPAGGVFLGVFQFGAIAALKDYGVTPDLYAGASVGTIFSYLLQASLTAPSLAPVVHLSETLPEWIDDISPTDASQEGVSAGSGRRNTLDIVQKELKKRWASKTNELASLRPREVVDMFMAATPSGPQTAVWNKVHAGLNALLFTPLETHGPRPTQLGDEYRLGATEADRLELREMFSNLYRFRLSAALEGKQGRPGILDRIAANLDFYRPQAAKEGEVIGFSSIERELRKLSFVDSNGKMTDPTLDAYSKEKDVKFIFSVTNHTRGMVEYLGYDDGFAPKLPSPLAVQACLAASSFPLAFRRRSRQEVFGPFTAGADEMYADGGIFNNFPSDTAFAYLRSLTDQDETRWIGSVSHRVLLLSLTSPTDFPETGGSSQGLVSLTRRCHAMSEDEKVSKTLRSQRHINALAKVANPLLAEGNQRQAIRAEMELISPAYTIYSSAFALKPYLGFKEKKEYEMLASGCRRTRIALEWAHYQDYPPVPRTDIAALRDAFWTELRTEVDAKLRGDAEVLQLGETHKKALLHPCVFGRFSPKRPRGVSCPFADDPTTMHVYTSCKETVNKELSVIDVKLPRRLNPDR